MHLMSLVKLFQSYSVLKGRVPNRDHLPPIHRYGYSSGAEGAKRLVPQEAAAHQDLQAPHHRQPHLPQPLLRLQKPQKETRVSSIFIWYWLNVLTRGRKVMRRQPASSEMLSQSVFFIYLDDLPQRVGQLHLHVVDFGPDWINSLACLPITSYSASIISVSHCCYCRQEVEPD